MGFQTPGIVAEEERRGGRDVPIGGVNGVSSSKPRETGDEVCGTAVLFSLEIRGGKGVRITQLSVWNSRAHISNS